MNKYIVIELNETDGDPVLKYLSKDEISERKHELTEACIIDGEVIKGFGQKVDVSRLRAKSKLNACYLESQ